jgi:hypothetical protein
MKKIYLVWCRYKGDTEDRIRGVALNYERAERMALNLEFHLQLEKCGEVTVGVKTYLHGEMFTNSEECNSRWGKSEFEVINESW